MNQEWSIGIGTRAGDFFEEWGGRSGKEDLSGWGSSGGEEGANL